MDFSKSIPGIIWDSFVPEIISVFILILFLWFSVTLQSSTEIKIRIGHVLGVSESTPANYRLKGIFGYYSLEDKILYADTEIEGYLKENYHTPYR